MKQSVIASCAQLLLWSEPVSLHVQTVGIAVCGEEDWELFWKQDVILCNLL